MHVVREGGFALTLPDGRVLIYSGESTDIFNPGLETMSPGPASAITHSTATLLANGGILALGGPDFPSAEVLDPGLLAWTLTSPPGVARMFGHTATRLVDGRVLIAGGFNSTGTLSSAELFDPATNSFTPTSPLAIPRRGHSATLLADGRVLVVGGTNIYPVLETEIYVPSSGMWSAGPSVGTSRNNHTATRLIDNRVLITGTDAFGYGPGSGTLLSEILDVAATAWTPTAARPSPGFAETASLLRDGRILFVGGYPSSARPVIYDPISDTWVVQRDLLQSRRAVHVAAPLHDGRVLVAGGNDGAFFVGSSLASTELFEPSASAWDAIAAMGRARTCHTASLLGSGQLLVLSGLGPDNSGERLDLATGHWAPVHPMPAPGRNSITAVTLRDGRVLTAGGDLDQVSTAHAEIYDPVADSWTVVGALQEPRRWHTGALMADGRVLVASGLGTVSQLSSAEIFDPASRTWTLTNPMISARYGPIAFVLSDGRPVVVGNDDAGRLGVEVLDVGARSWAPLGATISFESAFTAALLADNRILIVGNAGTQLFDPSSGAWAAADPVSRLFTGPHTATRLNDGRVLVVGGAGSTGSPASSSQIFDPSSGHWSPPVELGSDRKCHTATRLDDGRVAVAGGDWSGDGNFPLARHGTTEVYDPATNRWSALGTIARPRMDHTASNLPDGRLLVVGGSTQSEVTASTELFDPATDSWSGGASMRVARHDHTATVLGDGRIVVAGGRHAVANEAVQPTEVYDHASRTWTDGGNLNEPRAGHGATLLGDGRVLVAGGITVVPGAPPLSSAEIYDPVTRAWTVVAPMGSGRSEPAMIRLGDGRVLVLGGREVPEKTVEIFNPATGVWSAAAPLAQERLRASLSLLRDGRVLVAGGTPSGVPSLVEAYNPTTNSWATVGSMPALYAGEALTSTMPDGRVLMALNHTAPNGLNAATTTAVYDPVTARLSFTHGPRAPHLSGTSTVLADGRVLLVSGHTRSRYNPLAEAFGSKGTGPGPSPSLSVSITAPDHLTTNGTEYTPNPFDVVVRVSNTGAGDSLGTALTVYLPAGLSYLQGTGHVELGAIPAGTARATTFAIRADGSSTDRTVAVIALVTNAASNRASARADIAVPGILSVQRFTPASGGNAGRVTLRVVGSGFVRGAIVRLGDLASTETTFVSDQQLTARFDLEGSPPGPLPLRVVNPGGASIVAPGAFTVVEGGEPDVRLDILAPLRLRSPGLLERVPFFIVTSNNGTIDAEGFMTPLGLSFIPPHADPAPATPAVPTIDPVTGELRLPFDSESIVNLPTVAPGTSTAIAAAAHRVQLSPGSAPSGAAVAGARPASHVTPTIEGCLGFFQACRDQAIEVRDSFLWMAGAFSVLVAEFHAAIPVCTITLGGACPFYVGAIIVTWHAFLNTVNRYLAAVKALNTCLRIHGQPEVSVPSVPPDPPDADDLAVQIAAGAVGPPGVILAPLVRFVLPFFEIFFTCGAGPLDPNAKYGPPGVGEQQWIPPGAGLPYMVMFENKPTATAAAQRVVVSDAVDPAKVDLSTFSFGPIRFGPTVVTPPPGAKHFAADVDLRPAQNFIVRINADLDEATGEITWTFVSLDPVTRLPTTDVLGGFLPPNAAPPEGEGQLLYSVRSRADVTTGTAIGGKATIVFDDKGAIDTEAWINRVDAIGPIVTASRMPTANPAGWNRSAVVVTPACTDAHAGVGFCTDPVTVDVEADGPSISLLGTDGVGNRTTTVVSDLKIDKTPPTVRSSATTGGSPHIPGTWTNQNVVVSFECADTLSGVGSVTGPTTVTSDGKGQSVAGSCNDVAGNETKASVGGIDIDKTPPASSVSALGPVQTSATFPVAWSGSDGGSGIKDYTIFVSENGGAFTPWIQNTTSASASFTGGPAGTYGFYSVARDLAGNVEGPPADPDTRTVVLGVDVSTSTSSSSTSTTRPPTSSTSTTTGSSTTTTTGSSTTTTTGSSTTSSTATTSTTTAPSTTSTTMRPSTTSSSTTTSTIAPATTTTIVPTTTTTVHPPEGIVCAVLRSLAGLPLIGFVLRILMALFGCRPL